MQIILASADGAKPPITQYRTLSDQLLSLVFQPLVNDVWSEFGNRVDCETILDWCHLR